LEKLDKTIKTRPSFDGRVADYSAVEAHFLKYNSGRGKMEQSFEKPWKTSRLISREVAEVVKGIPTNEGVLIFVFKQHGDRVNIQDQLVSDLIAEGIDPTSELDVLDIKTGEQRREKRIQFLTWGNETSLSEFCWCSNLIFAGVLQKPPHVLEALSHGQKGGQLETADEDEVSQVHLTEVATLIHQAAGRGSMRIIRDGKASPMRLWFMHWNSKVKKYIRQVLPGVRISRWKSQYVDPMSAIIDDAAEKIVAALHSLPEEQDSISLKALKALAGYGPVEEGLKPIAPQTWRDARDAAIDYLDDAWYVDGGQMKRQSNVFP